MNLIKRVFKIGQSEAHSLVDKLENPIKLTEQGIRDLKEDLDKSLKALAEVKAMAIRSKNEVQTHEQKIKDYESKAIQLLQKAQRGEVAQDEADRLAESALQKKEEHEQSVLQSKSNKERFDKSVSQLEVNINKIKGNISQWENELKTLKARAKVAEATRNVNKQMSNIDTSGTVSMLERMKEKVDKDEALAEAYGEIAGESKSLDDEIDTALNTNENSASSSLSDLKSKLGM